MKAVARALLTAALISGLAGSALANTSNETGVFRFPSAEIPDETALRSAVQSSAVRRIVVEKGTHTLTAPLFVFGREDGLTICSASGKASNTTFELQSTVNGPLILVEQSRNVEIVDLSLTNRNPVQPVVSLSAVVTLGQGPVESFCQDVRIEKCRIRGGIGMRATTGVEQVTVERTRFTVVTGNGRGIDWQDGDALFVNRCTFQTDDATAFAGILVQGVGGTLSDGERSRNLVFSRNRVQGDFQFGIDVGDVDGIRVRRNKIRFPDSIVTPPGGSTTAGRIGVRVRRLASSSDSDDAVFRSNRVRGAHYGLVVENVRTGAIRRNDLRTCGSSATDDRFGDNGGGLRIVLNAGECRFDIERNDVRSLASPNDQPAFRFVPGVRAIECFQDDDGAFDSRRNKSGNRALIEGATP